MGDNKHLASLGRFGDNKLRDVDGEMSHVNAFEAWWSDNLPKETADRMIKSHGAGTRNPSTGLKEYHGSFANPWNKPMGHPMHHWTPSGVAETVVNSGLRDAFSEYEEWRQDHDIEQGPQGGLP